MKKALRFFAQTVLLICLIPASLFSLLLIVVFTKKATVYAGGQSFAVVGIKGVGITTASSDGALPYGEKVRVVRTRKGEFDWKVIPIH